MLHRSAPAALVQVLQGHFWGQTPAFVQADAGSFAGYRPAPHAEAAVRGAMHPPPRAVQPMRQGHAFRLPASIHVAAVGPGQPLPAVVQRKMESLFGTSFADVRVHVGLQARQIGAQAFTLGTDLYFAPGQYDPASAHGQRLLGHELTHVVQQRAGRVRNPFGSGVAVVQDPGLEAEAERMGLRAAAPLAVQPAMIVQRRADLPPGLGTAPVGPPPWPGVPWPPPPGSVSIQPYGVVIQPGFWDWAGYLTDVLSASSVITTIIGAFYAASTASGWGWLIPLAIPLVSSLVTDVLKIEAKQQNVDPNPFPEKDGRWAKYEPVLTKFVTSLTLVVMGVAKRGDTWGGWGWLIAAFTSLIQIALEVVRVRNVDRDTIYGVVFKAVQRCCQSRGENAQLLPS